MVALGWCVARQQLARCSLLARVHSWCTPGLPYTKSQVECEVMGHFASNIFRFTQVIFSGFPKGFQVPCTAQEIQLQQGP